MDGSIRFSDGMPIGGKKAQTVSPPAGGVRSSMGGGARGAGTPAGHEEDASSFVGNAEREAISKLRRARELTLSTNELIQKNNEANQKERDALRRRRDEAIAEAERAETEACAGARERCRKSVEQTLAERDQLLGDFGFRRKFERIETTYFSSKSTSARRNRVTRRMDALDALFEEKVRALNEYADSVVSEQHAATAFEKANAKAAFERENAQARERMQKDYHALLSRYRAEMEALLGQKRIMPFIKSVRASVPHAAGYVCATALPELFALGYAELRIVESSDLDPALRQQLSEVCADTVYERSGGTYVALPYAQTLESGVSLFLNHSSREREKYHRLLSLLLLRLFMAFPPGKLEATMIDPLGMGGVFAAFSRLGEERKRIINTKAWSQEKDIEQAMFVLHQKLETLAQAYGDDVEVRRRHVPYRVLAIMDFPTGFTVPALRDLQAIVRKGADLGVFVFIWANAKEVAKLERSRLSVFNEIKQMLHPAIAEDGGVMLETYVDVGAGTTGAVTQKDILLAFDDMNDIEEARRSIIETIAAGLRTASRHIVDFEDMFDGVDDPNNWCGMDSIREYSVPIGIRGASSRVRLCLGASGSSTAHHALIAGQTGAGKSTLLHTIIMSTLLNYSPDEVQLYLVDFKEGVTFKPYARHRLPSLRVVAIDSEREFGLNILRMLCEELATRATRFAAAGYDDIGAYRAANKGVAPKLLLLFDEVQALLTGDDEIAKESVKYLHKLVTQGRAMGIHIILASQDFRLASGISELSSQMAVRIAIKGDPDSARSVLGEGNPGAMQLEESDDPGMAVYNDRNGDEQANVIFQIAYTTKEKREDYLCRLEALQNSDALRGKYAKYVTRLLLTGAEDDFFNAFNTLILENRAAPLFPDEPSRYGLLIGSSFEMYGTFRVGMAPKPRANLLVVGSEEKHAYSIFCFSILSVLYGELANSAARNDDQLVLLADMGAMDEYRPEELTSFQHLASLFPQQVSHTRIGELEALIRSVYERLERRMAGDPSRERLFLMLFGINRAVRLINESMYDEEEGLTTLNMLLAIIKNGPQFGISCIVWGENLESTTRVLGEKCERGFDLRTAFSTDKETLEQLVMEFDATPMRESTAAFIDLAGDYKNTHFRPYEIPTRRWVKAFAKAYHEHQ